MCQRLSEVKKAILADGTASASRQVLEVDPTHRHWYQKPWGTVPKQIE